ncbi:MAG TPA: 1,4-alpha-glucan branching protein GlgB [Candidatus Udaeobacter sp.]|jgi:1,4-alpha-glucan branching enzyme|nr:1,4-alpha-glucan branching protein GlgB [Candidatus Udaeobacter sp.]
MTEPFISEFDLHLLGEGTHLRSWERLGAHLIERDGESGAHFAVWAPNAREVALVGDFNGWREGAHPLAPTADSGIWQGFVPGLEQGALYKYSILSHAGGERLEKADPFAFATEIRPRTASKVWPLSGYAWRDQEWMASRAELQAIDRPISIYEVHLGSWRRVPEQGNRWLGYREVAEPLADHALAMGFTHVELLPVMEHPFDGSWGYQTVGYFAPTSRFGTPQDFMFLIDTLHQRGLGVILDWVPAHFPNDPHGLACFDGTALYEHADPRLGRHPDWGTLIFNYGRTEVQNFLIANALFWLECYHADGLRVDAVASMLYLDYSRKAGEWLPNRYGGRENLDAIQFLKRLNEKVYGEHPGIATYAEESTAWPNVSRPTFAGGLGFGYKWDLGWMHDTLDYLARDPVHRPWHQNRLTFRGLYYRSENYVLPLSHDEVVHGKGSLLAKMPGDAWQKFANLRLLFGTQMAQPGKKLLFMGDEFAQGREWDHDSSLEWHLLGQPLHRGIQRFVRDLNTLYRGEPALHQRDCEGDGFEWVDCSDIASSIMSLLRRGRDDARCVLVVFNFTPVPRWGYRVGVPWGGSWKEILNSDASLYGGSGQGNLGGADADGVPMHGRSHSITISLPPLSLVAFRGER